MQEIPNLCRALARMTDDYGNHILLIVTQSPHWKRRKLAYFLFLLQSVLGIRTKNELENFGYCHNFKLPIHINCHKIGDLWAFCILIFF